MVHLSQGHQQEDLLGLSHCQGFLLAALTYGAALVVLENHALEYCSLHARHQQILSVCVAQSADEHIFVWHGTFLHVATLKGSEAGTYAQQSS